MALPTNRIFLQSPYYVSLSRANLEKMIIELYVYTGTLTTDKPATYQYRLTSTAHDGYAEIDISEYARDFVEVTYSGTEVTNAVWIEYDLYYADDGDTALTLSTSVDLTGVNGWGYFEDGTEPDPGETIFQSTDYVIMKTGEDASVPVLQDFLTGFELYDNEAASGSPIDSTTGLTTTENTANVIYYASAATGAGTVRAMKLLFSGGKPARVIKIKYLNECRYTAIRISFVNRFGAVQRLWCMAKSSFAVNTSETRYKRNLRSAGTYSTARHQNKTLTKNGISTITVNTNFYPESSNATFNELMLSEDVWADIPSEWLDFNSYNSRTIVAPVNIREQGLQFKTSANDGPINYTFTLEFASDRKNTVR